MTSQKTITRPTAARCVCGAIALALVCGTASAQVVTPPPGPPPATPEYTPPPERTAPPQPRAARPQTPSQQARAAQQRLQQVDLEAFDIPDLAERDDRGRLMPLDGPTELVAIRRNPLIGDDQRDELEAALAERRRAMAQTIAAHADVMYELDGGLLERITGTASGEAAQADLNAVMEQIGPVLSEGSAARSLYTAGALSAEQAAVSERMAQDYRAARLEQIRADFLPEIDSDVTLVDLVIRQALRERSAEASVIYRDLLLAAAEDLTGALDQAGIDGDARGMLRAQERAALATDATDAKLEIMRDVMTVLNSEQRAALLSTLVEAMRIPATNDDGKRD